MRRSVLLALLSASALTAGLLAGAVMAPAHGAASDPIVGTWTNPTIGSVTVTSTGTNTYQGVTATPSNWGHNCTHQAGQQIWTMTAGSGTSYAGTHVGFWLNDCSANPQSAQWLIRESTPGTLTLYLSFGQTNSTFTRPGTLATPSATGLPKVSIRAPEDLILQRGRTVSFDVRITVEAGDELVNWQLTVYDGDSLKPLTYQYGPIYDPRGGVSRTATFSFQPGKAAPSAYFVCGYAMTSAQGIKSANAPWTSCQWLKIDQVVYGRWTNRKTCDSPDDASGAFAWMTSLPRYGGIRVDFRDACGMRDSGYRGIVVQEPITKKWYDFRTWTRAQVDDLFVQLLRIECQTQIPSGRAYANARKSCLSGANNYYAATRNGFQSSFDADLTAGGIQTTTNPAALPPGGQRDNA